MKKITLFFCFSIVGLIGFAQQEKNTINIIDLSNQSNNLTVRIDYVNSSDVKDKNLLESNDFRRIDLENNTHELSHNSSTANNIDSRFVEGAYSYNEYALNFDIKPITYNIVKI